MALEHAIALANQLRDTLSQEVERSRNERRLLRGLDSDGLLVGAAARAGFNGQAAELQRGLAEALRVAAAPWGFEEVTLEALATKVPGEAAQLSRVLGEVRALASALAELDQMNRALASRALAVVQGYLVATSTRPAAYDRRGLALAATAPGRSTQSVRV